MKKSWTLCGFLATALLFSAGFAAAEDNVYRNPAGQTPPGLERQDRVPPGQAQKAYDDRRYDRDRDHRYDRDRDRDHRRGKDRRDQYEKERDRANRDYYRDDKRDKRDGRDGRYDRDRDHRYDQDRDRDWHRRNGNRNRDN